MHHDEHAEYKEKLVEVLYIEDDPDDVLLTRKAISECNAPINLTVIEDGDDAVDYLLAGAPHADRTTPDVILLDINLPKSSGFDILRSIKKDASLSAIPVLMFTSSLSDVDKVKSYGLRADYHIPKPASLAGFIDIVNWIKDL